MQWNMEPGLCKREKEMMVKMEKLMKSSQGIHLLV